MALMGIKKEADLFRVARSKFGRGLFAVKNIKPGIVILQLKGPRITYRQVIRLLNPDNAFQVGANDYIDLLEPGVLGNHSCQPNAGVTPRLELVALQTIERGAEIRFDYSSCMDKETECDFVCCCGSTGCRKIIKGFSTLPKRVKETYIRQGIVQPFLV